jgi:hypothetical protein
MTTDKPTVTGRPRGIVKAKADEVPSGLVTARAAADIPADIPTETPPGCQQCFPHSWPEGSSAVACDHGSWEREPRTDIS